MILLFPKTKKRSQTKKVLLRRMLSNYFLGKSSLVAVQQKIVKEDV